MTPSEVPARSDVVVIGAGLIGSYVAWQLAVTGASVVVLESGLAGDGSTGRSSGGLRRQFASSYEIELSTNSFAFYERLECDPDFPSSIERVGYVFFAGPDDLALLQRSYKIQREHGIGVEWLDPDTVRTSLPYCDPSGVAGATRTAADGFINPWDVHQWIWRRARTLGVVLRQHTPVHSIRRDGSDWLILGPKVRVRAGQVVVAAGAWTAWVLDGLGSQVPVRPSPRVKVLTDHHPQLPVGMPLITDLATGSYVRSERGRALIGVKPEPIPYGFSFDTRLDRLAAIVERATARFPSLADAGLARPVYGLYEITPDALPVAGPIPDHPGLHVIAGFNGHGIMHGPAVADALCAGISGIHDEAVDLAPLKPDRFTNTTYDRKAITLL